MTQIPLAMMDDLLHALQLRLDIAELMGLQLQETIEIQYAEMAEE